MVLKTQCPCIWSIQMCPRHMVPKTQWPFIGSIQLCPRHMVPKTQCPCIWSIQLCPRHMVPKTRSANFNSIPHRYTRYYSFIKSERMAACLIILQQFPVTQHKHQITLKWTNTWFINRSIARQPIESRNAQDCCRVGRYQYSTSGHATRALTTNSRANGSKCGDRKWTKKFVSTWFAFLSKCIHFKI